MRRASLTRSQEDYLKAPALFVIALGFDPTQTLVISQVVLSFGLPFAVVPLVIFTSDPKIMGTLVNRPPTTIAAWGVTAVVVGLNLLLIAQTFGFRFWTFIRASLPRRQRDAPEATGTCPSITFMPTSCP